MRDRYILTYDGHSWNLINRNELLNELYTDSVYLLESQFNKLLDKLDDTAIRQFNRFLEHRDIDLDSPEIIIIKDELKKMMYNHRNMVLKTRQKHSIDNK
jgi:succinate dehydrogenase flavin-adding protein (antitoxin of CptAB toxin-antitoxin module)